MVSPADVFRPLGQAAVDAFDDTRSWVAPNGYTLSDRVWRARSIDSGAVDSILVDAIAGGRGAVDPVKALARHLNPSYPGGNYGASRIARTETTRAFGQEAMRSARANPFVSGMKWNKSAGHRDMDQCDNNARNSSRGMGPGEYAHAEVPPYPAHPQCKCFLTPVLRPDATHQVLADLMVDTADDAPHVMSREEAEAWAADSAYKDDAYIFLSDRRRDDILKNGFDYSKGIHDVQEAGPYIYTTTNPADATTGVNTANRLTTKVNARRVLEADSNTGFKRALRAEDPELYEIWQDTDPFDNTTRDPTPLHNALRERGFDAILLKNQGGAGDKSPWLLVLDPDRIKIVQAAASAL